MISMRFSGLFRFVAYVVLFFFAVQFAGVYPYGYLTPKRAVAASDDEDDDYMDEDEEDTDTVDEEEEDTEEDEAVDTAEDTEDEENVEEDEEDEDSNANVDEEEEEEEESKPAHSRAVHGDFNIDIEGELAAIVIPAGTSSKEAASEAEIFTYEWLEDHGVKTVDILTALGGKHRIKPKKFMEEAAKLLSSAQEDYSNSDYDAAIEKLKKAESKLRPVLNEEGALDMLIEALVLHGASLALNLDDEIATGVFKQALALKPQLELSDEYPDMVKDIFAEARTQTEDSVAGALVIKTSPSGARIYVDGAFRGLSPIMLDNVSPGAHTVIAKLTGFWESIKDVEVNEGEKTKVKFKLTPASDYPKFRAIVDRVASDFEHPALYKQAKRLSRLLDAPNVLLLRVNKVDEETKYKLYVYNIDEEAYKMGTSSVPKGVDAEEELGYLLANTLSDETEWLDANAKQVAAPAGGVIIKENGEEVKQKEETPFYATWWFWTIVGGTALLAAGAGVGTWLYLKNKDSGSQEGSTLVIQF